MIRSITSRPRWIHGINRLGFFSDLDQRAPCRGTSPTSRTRAACVGQLYFHIILAACRDGQHWLNIKFAHNNPFACRSGSLTKEEQKTLSKNYSSIKKQVEAAFKPKKK